MPYDSSLPADHAPVVAAELRNQLNGLADMINSSGITQHQLDDAIASQTAGPADTVAPLDPNTASVVDVATKLNELIARLQRQ